jgi:hypothetical protein
MAQPSTTPAWVGQFSDFNSANWKQHWGIIPDTLICNIAEGTAPCNWGYPNLKAIDDATTPGGGQALEVTYPAPSGPPSCKCGIGGAQMYQDLKIAGQEALTKSATISLKYHYKFPVGFDFGKNTGGKMPGLYGGEPGCESGGQRCPGAWSTRYMWRGGSQAAPNGVIYWYSASGSGYGTDLGLGNWKWKADGQWHAIEQLVNTTTGKITIWHDGAMAFQTTQKFPGPATGIFFSTFHGGHDTGWSPSKKTMAQFALFTIATDAPQAAPGMGTADAGPGGGADAGTEADAPGGGTGGAGGAGDGAGTAGSGGAGNGGASGGVPNAGSGGASGGGPGAGASGASGATTGTGGAGGTTAGRGGTPSASGGATSPAAVGTSDRATSGSCSFGGGPAGAATGICTATLLALALGLRRRRHR